MPNRAKLFNNLGLALRAGKLVTGEEFVVEGVRKGTVLLVLLGNNAGPNTTKKITDKTSFYNVELIKDFSVEEISGAIGKSRVVVGITDKGFKEMILKQRG